jgi:type IV secretion system protein VirD4
MGEVLILIVVGLVVGLVYQLSGGIGGIAARASRPAPLPKTQPQASLSPPKGPLPSSLKGIEEFHANELNVVSISVVELQQTLLRDVSFYRLGRAMADKLVHIDKRADEEDYLIKAAGGIQREYLAETAAQALRGAVFQRTLRDLDEAQRATLRLADLLSAIGHMSRVERLQIMTPIIWNRGDCLLQPPAGLNAADMLHELRQQLTILLEGHLGPVTASAERLQETLRQVLASPNTLTQQERATLQRMLYQGARWMAPDQAETAMVPKGVPSPSVLRLGRLEGSQAELLYDRNESLITIAPPGQGKSQSVQRNLLMMDGGAVVIDIKGELFEETAVWRAKNVGPVYRFAPSDPANSISFNPLDAIRSSVEDAYEDTKKLVNLLIVPEDLQKKDYWDKRGLGVLADALLDAAMFEERGGNGYRTMSAVFDRLYLPTVADGPDAPENAEKSFLESDFHKWIIHLKGSNIKKLVRSGQALRSMHYKQRESILDTARTNIDVWQSPRIERLSEISNFDPLSLRNEKATLYICVSLDELEEYASFFRALLGQTFYALCRGKPDRDAPVVTFFLDEMPKLKRLDILETALDLGRGYGVRLWMFAQNYGQLAEHYKNPAGFLENSYVRQFMGMSLERANEFSRFLGDRLGIIDGKRRPLVEPHELAGPEFRDLILTICQGHEPARVQKVHAYKELAGRIVPATGMECTNGRLKLPESELSARQTPPG